MILKIRGQDAYGAGHYGARRTKGRKVYKHEGIDPLPDCALGIVRAFEGGKFTKIGRPYLPLLGDKSKLRYVQITADSGMRYRYFYVLPDDCITIGDMVDAGQIIGQMQGIEHIFKGITPHYHFEIMKAKSRHKINPVPVLEALGYELI